MSVIRPSRIEFALRPGVIDARGRGVAQSIKAHLGLPVSDVATADIFTFDVAMSDAELQSVRRELTDPVIQISGSPRVTTSEPFDWLIIVGFKPGVTDNVARTTRAALTDILGRKLAEDERVYTATGYFLSGAIDRAQAESIAGDLLANLLIETVEVISPAEYAAGKPEITIPRVSAPAEAQAVRIDMSGDDEALECISREGTLSLTLAEMTAVRDHFRAQAASERRKELGLDERPTDVELEMIAQTWSEHCKHKIFSGTVNYVDEAGNRQTIKSLFKTYIQGATAEVDKKVPWLVSVFHDNAGVVAFNDRLDIVYKVETHNSPSALEPYGGAMTGIVGCNRDPLGTGMGAELLVNVWGYCFASPYTERREIPEGVMHPRRLRDGVHRGVIDGGNQSGIPYGVGWEFFDTRYLAKPMVYCGTLGKLPKALPDGRPAASKEIKAGDLAVMIGGRIGKDGIHGATFSSVELHKDSPTQAVQIGDPITQKKMSDFLIEARDLGLYNGITDNGAGGLSSSIGEMAETPGGVEIDLAKAPLKYQGLQPWEIWLSEAQERMSLSVASDTIEALQALALRRDVELTILGTFNDSGYIHLLYGEQTVGLLEMTFLHEGCPEMVMEAEWTPPVFDVPQLPEADLSGVLGDLMARLNIASKEYKSRQYDHEVKGRTVLKPLIGVGRDVPSDATIFLAEYGEREGVVLSRGFNAHYSDLDCYAMIGAVMDEAIRRILAVGGRLDFISGLDNFCWPDPVESTTTPDGRYKMAQLVRANKALYDYCVAFNVPLISGKDSMKNDSTRGGRKISIPPSMLFSALGKIDDVDKAVTMEAKAPGDFVYVIGTTRDELGGSELAWMLNEQAGRGWANPAIGGQPPQVDAEKALEIYRAVEAAIGVGAVRSMHAPTLGGLGVGLAMVAMGGEVGVEVYLAALPVDGDLSDTQRLFSESAMRFIATVAPEKAEAFEAHMAGVPWARVGVVTEATRVVVKGAGGQAAVEADIAGLKKTWKGVLEGV